MKREAGSTKGALRKGWRALREAPPGTRFRKLHDLRKEQPRLRIGGRPAVSIALGILLVVGGLAIGWLPGPGGFIAIVGLALLAMEFRWVATLLDQVETALRWVWSRLWGRRSTVGRTLVVVAALTIVAAAAVFLLR